MLKRYKWLFILLLSLGLIVGFTAFHSQKANAAEPTTVSAIKVAPEQRNLGGQIVKPFYSWLPPQYCYWRSGITSSSYYCYRYGCTYFEKVAWGCYEGYVRMTTLTRV